MSTHRIRRLLACSLMGALTLNAQAAQTDISSTPFSATLAPQAKPNIMLLMDTSGSMGWGHMPDDVETPNVVGGNLTSVGYKNAQCNVLYYNPTTLYTPPKRSDGTFFPTPSFNSAPYDAFDVLSVIPPVNLATSFKAYDSTQANPTLWSVKTSGNTDVAQAAYYYVHTGGTPITSYAAPACLDAEPGGAASDGGTWTRVDVSAASAAVKQNFAIWYSYYRTRMSLTKSAASLAFTPLTDSFRVGFITVNPKATLDVATGRFIDAPTASAINPLKYLPIADFDSTQRTLWFDKLFSQKPGGSSPAREGLARVGRHYAGKHDGINEGMTGDPVQYYCQQNFTIMTTDGYWNDQGESKSLTGGFIGGPVDKTGQVLVGQRDGNLTTGTGDTPRPIWDGVPDAHQVITDKRVQFSNAPCGTYFSKTTTQVSQSTSQITLQTVQSLQNTSQNLQSTSQVQQTNTQVTQSTSQPTQSSFQNLQSTNQNRQNVLQNTESHVQATSSTIQYLQTTNQNLQSTVQNLQAMSTTNATTSHVEETVSIARQTTTQMLQSTHQNLQSTTQTLQGTIQYRQSTVQNLASTVQNLQSTTQTTQHTESQVQNTVQNLQSTSQTTRSSDQTTRSTTQTLASTYQVFQTTSQQNIQTSQVRRTQTQLQSHDASTEQDTPVASCTPGGNITCFTVTSGPTLVDTCTNAAASAGNNYVATMCATTTSTATPTASCSPSSANGGNGHTTTTCPVVTTPSTAVASCNAATANSGNSYTTTTCSPVTSGPTAVASCSNTAASAGNSYTATTCSSNPTGPTPVQTCASDPATAGNSWTTTSCGTATTSNVPVASCTPASPTMGNNWATVTCPTVVTTNVPVGTCSNSGPTAGNFYTTTSCSNNNTTNVPVASCTPSAATGANSWTATTCPPPTISPSVGVSSCSPQTANAGNSYVATVCGSNNTTNVPVASCTGSGPNGGNSWTTTTCPPAVITNNVPVASCSNASAGAGNSYTATSCSNNSTTNVPVASCTASAASGGNGWTTTSCPAPITTGPAPVSSCSVIAPTAGNSYVGTTCTPNNTTNVPVATCTASGPTGGNGYVDTTCPAPLVTSNVPVASCTAGSANGGNAYTDTTCTPNNTTNAAVASCTASGPNAGNGYTTTTCPPITIVSGPTTVGSCTPVSPTAGNGYQRTDCNTISDTQPVGTCTPQSPNAGNGYVTITCNTLNPPAVPVASCTPQSPTAGNGYVTITCPAPIVTTNVPVTSCTASAATNANSWTTTTCPTPITSGPTPVASCTATGASSLNSYTSVACPPPVTTAAVGVSSCTPVSPIAGNNYVATVCGNNNTSNVPVQTCTPQTGGGGNSWLTITCGNNNASNVAVATCSPQTGAAGNSWLTITCAPSVVTTNVPVQTCTPDTTPTAGNSYTSTTCSTNNVSNTPSGSCVPQTAAAGNNWTTITCPTLTTGPVGVSSCTPQTGNAGNSWLTITCGNNNVAATPVSSCTPVTPTLGNNYLTVGCNTVTTTNIPVQTCSASGATMANSWTVTNCTPVTSSIPSGSCSPVTATAGNNWVSTTCPTVTVGPTGAASCVPETAGAGNSWTTTTCPTNVTTGPTPVASCNPQSATSLNSWVNTSCSTITTGPVIVSTCPAPYITPPIAANNFTETVCSPLSGSKLQYVLTTTVTEQDVSGGVPTGTPTVTTTVDPAADVSGVCVAPPSAPVIPTPNPQPAGPVAGPTPPVGCTAWPCTDSTNLTGPRSVNSLADVAQYYYVTDLRTDADWPLSISCDESSPTTASCNDPKGEPNVGTGPEDDRRHWQHMTTFSVALGVSGTLQYKPDYKSAATGDFADIRTGAKNWPLWPDPALDYVNNKDLWNDPKSIDDFWHAAVNGRGQYFNATDPRSVINGLAAALAGIGSKVAAGSGPGTSTLNPTTTDHAAYLASYTTGAWSGDVQAYNVDTGTGAIDTSAQIWSAKTKLNTRTNQACDGRNIYLIRTDGTKPANNLATFTWGTRTCDGTGNPSGTLPDDLNATEQLNFGALNVSLLSQYASMGDGTFGTPDQKGAAVGANLVNFLRGQHGLENYEANVAGKLYRTRPNVLGDVVGGQPIYVGAPFQSYADAGYATFKTGNAARVPMIYVAANDGMLHAFYASTDVADPNAGQEAWAVIPSAMLPNLWKLADNNYASNHRFYVDAAPVVSDAKLGGTWKTLLVGGFNAGGKGFYAMDVTSPLAPKALWEFKVNAAACSLGLSNPTAAAGAGSDCNLGLSFGQPVITKLTNGTWVVMVTSGYNNVNAAINGGDGQGFLYVLNAADGSIIYKMSTGVGDATTPSGLAQINNYVDSVLTDNTTLRVYGTDLFGNIWRFDVDNTILPAGIDTKLVATTKDAGGVPQPISTKPELAQISGKAMVFVGTGKLLGATDIGSTQVQSLYGIVDPMIGTTSPSYANLRSVLAPLVMATAGSTRTINCTGPLCGAANGWFVDLPETGERVNVDLKLQVGNLAVASNVPSLDACIAGGHSWFNQLDYKTGQVVPGNGTAVSQRYAQGLIVGFAVIRLGDGTVRGLIRFSNGDIINPTLGAGTGSNHKRVTWREVVR